MRFRSCPFHLTPVLAVLAGALVVFAVTLVWAADADWSLQALARMTGSDSKGGGFGQLKTYLDNLQKGLLPLAIPLGTIGLAGGGIAYMLGHHMAQKILGGVVAGTALVLLAPQLMA